MSQRSVAIRVDASPQMGIGHLMRCLTLADALREKGVTVRIVSRRLADSLHDIVASRGHECVVLISDAPVSNALAHAHWLGTDPMTDARETIQALAGQTWDWVVVDHYALDERWETALRGAARRIFAIDDLADRTHDCDVLLDQNHLPDREARYRETTPQGCRLLLGPRHALLRPEYREHREAMPQRNRPVERVLVFFGSDQYGMTTLALEALDDPRLRYLAADVVCDRDPGRRSELDRWAARRPGLTIHGPRPHLADLMARADLGVGAGGSTTWERMCLGLPSLVITLADNQVPLARWLDHQRLIRLLGHATDMNTERLREGLLDELAHRSQMDSIGAAMELSDGLGTSRVVETLQSLSGW